MDTTRRTLFYGQATGFGAHIRRPNDQILRVQAASALPITGGLSESHRECCKLGRILSFDYASSSAKGDFTDVGAAVNTTLGKLGFDEVPAFVEVKSRVEGLDVEGRVQIAVASFELRADLAVGAPEPTFRIGTRITGVVVDGRTLSVQTSDDELNECPTFGRLRERVKNFGPRMMVGENFSECGQVYGTLVRRLDWGEEGPPESVDEQGENWIHVRGVGKIFFAEVLASKYLRRVSTVRLQLGSEAGGSGGNGGEGGAGYWPE